jgi:hypothetical protein
MEEIIDYYHELAKSYYNYEFDLAELIKAIGKTEVFSILRTINN